MDSTAKIASGVVLEERKLPLAAIGWVTGLIVLLHFPVLTVMFMEFASDDSMGHGFFVPFVIAYLVWQRRAELLAIRPQPHWSGWVLLLWGFVQLLAGTLGADFFVMRTALVVTVLGALLVTGGPPLLRQLVFPLVLLLFMIRIPLFIYSQITFPLQLFASRMAELALMVLGIPVLREGNILELPSQRLNVVEACSGMRSLMSLAFLALVYGFFFEKKTWVRVLLLLLTIPISIFANALRVSLTGVLSEVNPELASGVFHAFEGWMVFMVALGALLLAHRCIGLSVAYWNRRKARHA
jgi:exosortase